MYIDFNNYVQFYQDGCDFQSFKRLSIEACRKLDYHTTGLDGVKKLKAAFPTDEDDARMVRYCACKIVHILGQIEAAETAMRSARGYEETENGIRGKVITSITAGNESISYAAGGGKTATMIDKALADKSVQDKLITDTIRECLSGIRDANGVNLLFMGRAY